MASWFLTFSSNRNEENTSDWAWQNPVYVIKQGFTQVITGFDKKDIHIDDTIYIYCGGDEFCANDENGLWGVGKVVDILTPKIENRIGFVIKLDKVNKEKPLVLCDSSNSETFKDLCFRARNKHKHGWLELNQPQIDDLDKLIV